LRILSGEKGGETVELEKPLEKCSISELIDLERACLYKMASCLCQLITREIDSQGTKKQIRAWLRTLRFVHQELRAYYDKRRDDNASLDDLLATIRTTEQEAEAFLFIPKRERG
jgi:hypothetical protein